MVYSQPLHCIEVTCVIDTLIREKLLYMVGDCFNTAQACCQAYSTLSGLLDSQVCLHIFPFLFNSSNDMSHHLNKVCNPELQFSIHGST